MLFLVVFNLLKLEDEIFAEIKTDFTQRDGLFIKMACMAELARVDIKFEDYINDERIFNVGKLFENQEKFKFELNILKGVGKIKTGIIRVFEKDLQIMPRKLKSLRSKINPYILDVYITQFK